MCLLTICSNKIFSNAPFIKGVTRISDQLSNQFDEARGLLNLNSETSFIQRGSSFKQGQISFQELDSNGFPVYSVKIDGSPVSLGSLNLEERDEGYALGSSVLNELQARRFLVLVSVGEKEEKIGKIFWSEEKKYWAINYWDFNDNSFLPEGEYFKDLLESSNASDDGSENKVYLVFNPLFDS